MKQSTPRYRYPGIRPFEAADQNTFFGRDRDLESLSLVVRQQPLTVLFGKSGTGKSSLVRAGLLPRLEADLWDTRIFRFGAFLPGLDSRSLPQLLLEHAQQSSKNLEQRNWLDELAEQHNIPLSLWHMLKKREFEADFNKKKTLLVFDQFEEIFTWPQEQLEIFKDELANVLFGRAPLAYQDALHASNFDLPPDLMEQLLAPLEVRLLFVMRSDRLSLLDRLKDRMPGILQARYEIKPFTKEQAESALAQPARMAGDFTSPPFDFEPAAMDRLLDKLENNQGEIEPFQLQILGQALEQRIQDNPSNTRIQPQYLPEMEHIYANYYQNELAKLSPDVAKLAQRAIEDGLLFESSDGQVRRLSLYEGILEQQYNLSPPALRQLTNTFLLRAEPDTRGGYNYEIAHDTLIAPILESKRRREKEEQREGRARSEMERQTNLFRILKRTRLLLLLSLLLNLLLFILLVIRW